MSPRLPSALMAAAGVAAVPAAAPSNPRKRRRAPFTSVAIPSPRLSCRDENARGRGSILSGADAIRAKVPLLGARRLGMAAEHLLGEGAAHEGRPEGARRRRLGGGGSRRRVLPVVLRLAVLRR